MRIIIISLLLINGLIFGYATYVGATKVGDTYQPTHYHQNNSERGQ